MNNVTINLKMVGINCNEWRKRSLNLIEEFFVMSDSNAA